MIHSLNEKVGRQDNDLLLRAKQVHSYISNSFSITMRVERYAMCFGEF